MVKKMLTLATRQSPLARWQAEMVKNALEARQPGLRISLLGLTTLADRIRGSLQTSGGKGLFVKELEEALLSGNADIAVHSMKDVPVNLPEGLIIPVMCARENPLDALVANASFPLEQQPAGTRVGTGSPRRACQLLAAYPHLAMSPLRGNIETRLHKLVTGELTAMVLAAAGLIRLGLTAHIQQIFSPQAMLPAAGQGAIGIECRADDADTQALIHSLNHLPTFTAVTAERALCKTLEADCHTPVAAFAEHYDKGLRLRGRVGSRNGKILLHTDMTGPAEAAADLGSKAAEDLLSQGARALLDSSA